MIKFKTYTPHAGQYAFHYALDNWYRFLAMICGVRGGKTIAGARESVKQAWNCKKSINGVYGIIAPTFHMLKRTTWREFKIAARPFTKKWSDSDMILILNNDREVHGFSADKPDRIRNSTLSGFWLDEGRECKEGIWDILLARVLSTGGKGILTTSPNSYDWIHKVFFEQRDKEYGVVQFTTYDNIYIEKEAISSLERKYDEKFARQEIHGEFVVFQGQVYYAFNRTKNAGDLAFKVAQYDSKKRIALCCDFNVDPMVFVIAQVHKTNNNLDEIRVIGEIKLRNSNTIEACQEFKKRYPAHRSGLWLYGDATGRARHSSSNVTNWNIIEEELSGYDPVMCVPRKNPAERDRVNAVNAMICNSKGERRLFVNPECKTLISDFEQVSYKQGRTEIDKTKDLNLTHASDALGYMIEKDYSLNSMRIEGLKV